MCLEDHSTVSASTPWPCILASGHPRVHLQVAELELFPQISIWQVVRMTETTDIFVLL